MWAIVYIDPEHGSAIAGFGPFVSSEDAQEAFDGIREDPPARCNNEWAYIVPLKSC